MGGRWRHRHRPVAADPEGADVDGEGKGGEPVDEGVAPDGLQPQRQPVPQGALQGFRPQPVPQGGGWLGRRRVRHDG